MQNKDLPKEQDEKQLIERAKRLLMTNRSMTEQQAHKYLQKQAMDRCLRKSEVAAAVIVRCGKATS